MLTTVDWYFFVKVTRWLMVIKRRNTNSKYSVGDCENDCMRIANLIHYSIILCACFSLLQNTGNITSVDLLLLYTEYTDCIYADKNTFQLKINCTRLIDINHTYCCNFVHRSLTLLHQINIDMLNIWEFILFLGSDNSGRYNKKMYHAFYCSYKLL